MKPTTRTLIAVSGWLAALCWSTMGHASEVVMPEETIKARTLVCGPMVDGARHCEYSGYIPRARRVAEALADSCKTETAWISPYHNGWIAWCGDSEGKNGRVKGGWYVK